MNNFYVNGRKYTYDLSSQGYAENIVWDDSITIIDGVDT